MRLGFSVETSSLPGPRLGWLCPRLGWLCSRSSGSASCRMAQGAVIQKAGLESPQVEHICPREI